MVLRDSGGPFKILKYTFPAYSKPLIKQGFETIQ